jgi:SAM-dependent methyltransferase
MLLGSTMKKVLHIGAGKRSATPILADFQTPEWQEIRLDINPESDPDIIGSMLDMGLVEDGSMDAICCCHTLEHLFPHEVPIALREFTRVLSPDGYAVIVMPDIQSVAEALAKDLLHETLYESPGGPVSALDIIFGHHDTLRDGNVFMCHKSGFSARTLYHALISAGFVTAQVARTPFTLWAIGYRTDPVALAQRAMG